MRATVDADLAPLAARGPGESFQGLDRIVAILRALADSHRHGMRLVDVTQRTGLTRSTCHRMLTALVDVGLVEQDEASGRYYPGLALVGLGAAAANRHDVAELSAPFTQRLADETGDTIYLSLRSGNDAVCVDRVEGAFPIKVFTWTVGDRRPLGLSASGLAILAALPDAEAARVIEVNAARIEAATGQDRTGIHALVDRTRQQGYAFNEGYSAPGMAAVAVPIRGAGGQPLAALCVSAITARLEGSRTTTVVRRLTEEASGIERHLQQLLYGLSAPALRRLQSASRR